MRFFIIKDEIKARDGSEKGKMVKFTPSFSLRFSLWMQTSLL